MLDIPLGTAQAQDIIDGLPHLCTQTIVLARGHHVHKVLDEKLALHVTHVRDAKATELADLVDRCVA